jgi:hypothetical protein
VPLARPSLEVVDMRDGEEFAGIPTGGAKVGQFFGLGSRVVCGEDNVAAVADATAVDMILPSKKKRAGLAVVPQETRGVKDNIVTAIYFDRSIQLCRLSGQRSLEDDVEHQ